MKLRKLLFTMLASSMLMLTACGSSDSSGTSSKTDTSKTDTSSVLSNESAPQNSSADSPSSDAGSEKQDSSIADSSQSAESKPQNKDTIVVYFSASGITKGVAQKIAEITSADIFEIVPEQKYTDADLDWNDNKSRSTIEMNDPDCRPKISGDIPDLSAYKKVFIGYPIWWGEAPRIMSTFVESVSLDGKTVIPFCTSGSSPIASSAKHLQTQCKSGNWMDGSRLEGSISKEELSEWIDAQK